MNKRYLSKQQINFLEEELNFWEKEKIISKDEKIKIIDLYAIKHVSFVKVILIIGAILLGLGVLSFIASNWDKINKISKFLIIILLYLGVNISSYRLRENYPKTSQSLLYLGVLVFGSGMFLVGQIFNFGGDFTTAFLLWSIGIIPISIFFKDENVFIFTHILFLIYLNGSFRLYDTSYFIIAIVPLLYYMNTFLKNSKLGTLFNNLVFFNTIGYFLNNSNIDGIFIAWIFLIIGFLMYYAPIKLNREIFKLEGILTLGISGLFLTIPDIWSKLTMFGNGKIISITFSICFIIYLFTLVKKGSLLGIVFICATIFRFYFDTLYDFMPKSMFFVIGGLVLIGFGYYFERMRNKKGGDFIEK